ncbi:MAG: glycosyltransferase family 4 protein [Brumimicrobium sp.]
MRVLINTTPPTNSGGVANHYKGLKKYWTEEVHYNYIGGRKGIPGSLIIIVDVLKFIFKMLIVRPDVVLLNPSLGKTAIKRDGVFLTLSKIFNKPTVVFFHGWDEFMVEKISKDSASFVKRFNKADKLLVLASSFKQQLQNWGITKPIELTTTKVDDELTEGFRIDKKSTGKTILFLARIEKAKGILIALESFNKIKDKIPDAELIVAGSGSALDEAKRYVEKENLTGVEFSGYVRGNDLKKTFKSSDVYLLPTYGEGMPTSVLEAMAFGLPVISRPVGGMVDFFENGKMGYLIDSYNQGDFAEKVIEILSDEEKLRKMGRYNYEYAKEHFYASYVAKQLENSFRELISN